MTQYWTWLSGVLHGQLRHQSLANGAVGREPRRSAASLNSLVLVVLAGVIGTLIGVGLGVLAAVAAGQPARPRAVGQRRWPSPRCRSSSWPSCWSSSSRRGLPPAARGLGVAQPGSANRGRTRSSSCCRWPTLVLVIVPYIFRMMRAAMIEALESDYVEMARLKGLSAAARPARPRAAERDRAHDPGDRAELPVPGRRDRRGRVRVQLPGHRAGPGHAVSDRDIPVIQFIVLVLAASTSS